MVKNIPSPCCGNYNVLIKHNIEKGEVWYRACCPDCGLTTNDSYDNRPEAIYEYEKMCIDTWRRNPNGLLNWLKTKPKDKDDVERRSRMYDDLSPYLLHR